jgi:hypothetical protein
MYKTMEQLEWLNPFTSVLPQSNKPIFTQIWKNTRFAYRGENQHLDAIDLWNARAVCAAIYLNKSLLVVLPDHAPHRPSILFANCLVADALDNLLSKDSEPEPPHRVVYFGTSVGIRDQLGAVSVTDLYLDTVFPLYRTTRSNDEAVKVKSKTGKRREKADRGLTSTLPQVICVYSPADPVAVIDRFEPTWLAVDCSDAQHITWLPSLLEYAARLDLPVVAWCQNPLAAVIEGFRQSSGLVLSWGRSSPYLRMNNDQAKTATNVTQLQPISLNPTTPGLLSRLAEASAALGNASRAGERDQQLAQDALRVGWRYLQALESLPVPLELYEAEIARFWGGTTIHQIKNTLARFVEAVEQAQFPTIIQPLRRAFDALIDAHDHLMRMDPPCWAVLTAIAQQHNQEDQLILVFPTESLRQLALFALLSRLNLTEDDLRARGVWLTTYKGWYRSYVVQEQQYSRTDKSIESLGAPLMTALPLDKPYVPILFGIPTGYHTASLEPLFAQPRAQIVMYNYQTSLLLKRVQEWRRAVEYHPEHFAETLACLTVDTPTQIVIPSPQIALQLVETNLLRLSTEIPQPLSIERLLEPLDAVDELSRLFMFSESDHEGVDWDAIAIDKVELGIDRLTDEEDETSPWIDHIVELKLEHGWHISLSADSMVQIVVPGSSTRMQARYARSVRERDRLLLIAGQQRQSLYDLILSRVHSHAAIEVHLAMIRRWQEDVASAYRLWRRRSHNNVNTLLIQLQSHGSTVTSTQTVRLWLNGRVLCPEDVDDLRRLSIVLDLPFLRDNYKHIDRAANRLAGIHRALSRRLNQWLQREAIDVIGDGEPDTTVLDKELGLTFNDFRDSLMVLTVETVYNRQGLFLRQNLGRLTRIGT